MQKGHIDRKVVPPFLLRVLRASQHYEQRDEGDPVREYHLYAWLDCSLRDLVTLLQHAAPTTRSRSLKFSLRALRHETTGTRSFPLGTVHSCYRSGADGTTLMARGFRIADVLDVVPLEAPPGD
ncbi:MAG: uncharacterized protein KVP18_001476 [Porospora cf. gigantea A]|nr:MAG: hypothetical protein KVP18_001476 [Porospora cf. gigantea A]